MLLDYCDADASSFVFRRFVVIRQRTLSGPCPSLSDDEHDQARRPKAVAYWTEKNSTKLTVV